MDWFLYDTGLRLERDKDTGVFIVDLEQISHIILMFLPLTFNKKMWSRYKARHCSDTFKVNFENI